MYNNVDKSRKYDYDKEKIKQVTTGAVIESIQIDSNEVIVKLVGGATLEIDSYCEVIDVCVSEANK